MKPQKRKTNYFHKVETLFGGLKLVYLFVINKFNYIWLNMSPAIEKICLD